MMFARAFNSAKVSWAIFGGESVYKGSDGNILTYICIFDLFIVVSSCLGKAKIHYTVWDQSIIRLHADLFHSIEPLSVTN
jgi:hypothetical protein